MGGVGGNNNDRVGKYLLKIAADPTHQHLIQTYSLEHYEI